MSNTRGFKVDMAGCQPKRDDTTGYMREYQRRRRAVCGGQREKENRTACIRRMENKAFVIGALGGKCSICGGEFPVECYDLHHTDPSKKENVPASISYDLGRLWAEVRQGVAVVCSNCHRTIHRKH